MSSPRRVVLTPTPCAESATSALTSSESTGCSSAGLAVTPAFASLVCDNILATPSARASPDGVPAPEVRPSYGGTRPPGSSTPPGLGLGPRDDPPPGSTFLAAAPGFSPSVRSTIPDTPLFSSARPLAMSAGVTEPLRSGSHRRRRCKGRRLRRWLPFRQRRRGASRPMRFGSRSALVGASLATTTVVDAAVAASVIGGRRLQSLVPIEVHDVGRRDCGRSLGGPRRSGSQVTHRQAPDLDPFRRHDQCGNRRGRTIDQQTPCQLSGPDHPAFLKVVAGDLPAEPAMPKPDRPLFPVASPDPPMRSRPAQETTQARRGLGGVSAAATAKNHRLRDVPLHRWAGLAGCAMPTPGDKGTTGAGSPRCCHNSRTIAWLDDTGQWEAAASGRRRALHQHSDAIKGSIGDPS